MRVTPSEIQSCKMTSARLQEAERVFASDGFVVLEGVIAGDRVQAARELCQHTLRRKNRIRCAVPYELLHRWPLRGVVTDTLAWPVLNRLLGAADDGTRDGSRDGSHIGAVEMCWFRICPPGGTSVGRVHRDRVRLRDPNQSAPSVSISVDVMLTEFTTHNGATEIWSGSQFTHETDPADIRAIHAQALRSRPSQIVGVAGSIALRDHRALHRGGVNSTDSDRCMFSSAGWVARPVATDRAGSRRRGNKGPARSPREKPPARNEADAP